MYQYHVARGDEPSGEDSVAVQGLDAFRKRAVDEAALLVEIPRQAIQKSLLEYNVEVALGGGVAVVPFLQFLLGDSSEVQGGTTYR